MKREKISLRPTALWLLFGPILGCMWLGAVNYSNNLVYASLYLVGSLTFVSIFHTWRNLAAIEVEHVRVHSAFAGGEVRVEIHLRNTGAMTAHGLFFARLDDGMRARRAAPLGLPGGRGVRVKSGDSRAVELHFPAVARGKYRFDALLVRTSYPFGLVGASFRLPFGADYFIYPEAKGDDFPALRPSGESGFAHSLRAGDDFSGVRPYTPGESLRHVDWKAFARGRPLSVKQFTGEDGQELWFDAGELAALPLEARLSQLTWWIVSAEKEEIPYVFQLEAMKLPLGLGPEQARRALEALAVAR
jgi:uncharacterized protein (DUF58 family)